MLKTNKFVLFKGSLLFLVGLGLLMRYFFYTDFSFSVLSYLHSKDTLINFHTNELLANQKLVGEFMAKDNYLGLISIRFQTFDRENDDIILFRLKEKGKSNWYFEEQYRTTFANNEFYNFGFVPIEDSRGKKYSFEIVSRRGIKNKAIALSDTQPVVMTKYQYPKTILLSNKTLLISHIFKKIMFLLISMETLFVISIYFLPFMYYLRTLHKSSNHLTSGMIFLPTFIVSLALWNIFFLSRIIDSTLLVIIVLSTIHYWGKKYERILFTIGLTFLLLAIALYSHNFAASIRAASWFYCIFIVYVLLTLKDIVKNK